MASNLKSRPDAGRLGGWFLTMLALCFMNGCGRPDDGVPLPPVGSVPTEFSAYETSPLACGYRDEMRPAEGVPIAGGPRRPPPERLPGFAPEDMLDGDEVGSPPLTLVVRRVPAPSGWSNELWLRTSDTGAFSRVALPGNASAERACFLRSGGTWYAALQTTSDDILFCDLSFRKPQKLCRGWLMGSSPDRTRIVLTRTDWDGFWCSKYAWDAEARSFHHLYTYRTGGVSCDDGVEFGRWSSDSKALWCRGTTTALSGAPRCATNRLAYDLMYLFPTRQMFGSVTNASSRP